MSSKYLRTLLLKPNLKPIQSISNVLSLERDGREGTYFKIIISAEIDGNECEPNNTRGIHCETDIFGFIEVFRYFPGLECIGCA